MSLIKDTLPKSPDIDVFVTTHRVESLIKDALPKPKQINGLASSIIGTKLFSYKDMKEAMKEAQEMADRGIKVGLIVEEE